MPTGVRARLGEILLKAGVITEEQLQEAVQARREAQGKKPRLEVVLVERGFATEENIASTLSQELNLPLIDLGTIDIDPKVTRMVPQWLAERHLLVPLRRTGDGVMVAMSDPTNLVAIDDIKVSARVGKVSVGVATHSGV